MSKLAVKITRINVEPHPDADKLEIGRYEGYQFIVGRGQFQSGDLGVYIPEGAIVPDNIIAAMGLEGKLAGGTLGENDERKLNRVKAIKLRGVLSQGLFYRPDWDWSQRHEGEDVADELGISKWQPPIPIEMAGQVEAAPSYGFFRTYTDIENVKTYPDVLQVGEQVRMTEKLHGSCAIIGLVGGQRVVSSKGQAGRHLALKENMGNVYWRVAEQLNLFAKLQLLLETSGETDVLLFGEVLGVQDLKYSLKPGQIGYRAFDIWIGKAQEGEPRWFETREFDQACRDLEIPTVPVLYEGPFSKEKMLEITSGQSTLANHIREGVVIRAIPEREDIAVGRVALKSVSPEYLLRKNGTEME